ncbi:uncharacterized protein LOC105772931 [Gossypium raimondii]|uniref:DUF3054 domain-containing protein n=1 Tax=Gossypium raimondii TaxID=29730 RepID=A0A0D2R0X1_GOSRA|nr:uncharacterized protein LOC105772931 [Gossypium raimondii]XP_012449898.1 uncharacterized protein LOC105772931 [Gossypium raimondii]KJB63986.1 hypothetical protein B456_010G028000 [Gossypium raimondii]KJB63987.1 hypothetical protein B456_010G028000 [Gossypium raimondii]
MFLISCPSGALSAKKCSLKFTVPIQPSISNSSIHKRPKFIPSRNSRKPLQITLAKAEGGLDSAPKQSSPPPPPSPSPFNNGDDTVFVGQDDVPLEGVIQFEKPSSSSSRLSKWGRVALLAGGDVLALLLFSAIGRYNHGLPIFAMDTIRTADPFLAGWFLSAYFLGGYSEDGRGANGLSQALIAAAKSWGLGIPLGLIIRAATSGHVPPYAFVLVTMGSTSVLLIGWRALIVSIFPDDTKKKNDVYRRGSPFELFELLTSLVRRW